jgi:hypothetical protein
MEQVGTPTVPSPSLEGPANLKPFGVTEVLLCRIVSQGVTFISFSNWHIFWVFVFLKLFVFYSVTV